MAVYIVTGKLGSGKTLAMVGRIQDALFDGRRVATNLNIYPEKLLGPNHKRGELWRVPDKPTGAELEALGYGNNDPKNRQEDSFGHLVLDECGTWLNNRKWDDPDREGLINWLVHARKWHWHVYLIIQHINAIDKQVREKLAEHVVVCRRSDRMKLPLIGVRLPKIHIGFVRYGVNVNDPIVERWIYRARDLYDSYDTDQKFVDRGDPESVNETYRQKLPGELPGVKPPVKWWARLFAPRGVSPAKPASPSRPHKVWPPHIAELTENKRWELARKLFELSPYAPVTRSVNR